jgi:hypothetical protein
VGQVGIESVRGSSSDSAIGTLLRRLQTEQAFLVNRIVVWLAARHPATTSLLDRPLERWMLALAGTLCLWWLYFRAEPIALKYVASAEDRVYASRMGTNRLLFMIPGLTALAAGNALVIAMIHWAARQSP